jgi:hypothetical protein
MLRSHPLISCTDEIGYITELVTDEGTVPDIKAYHEWLATDRIFQGRRFTIDKSLDFYQLINSFLIRQGDSFHKIAFGAISHFNFGRLLKLWPNARFIHLTRDGRDVAYSWVKEMHGNATPFPAAKRWLAAEQDWDNLASQLSSDRYIEITYEDLVSNTVTTLIQICQFLGVDYDDRMLTYTKTRPELSLPDPKYIGLWRSQLTNYEVQLAEAAIGDTLQKRGYPLSGLPRLSVNALMALQLKWLDRWCRLQHNIHQFGIRLMVLHYLARALHLTSWEKELRKEMNDIKIYLIKSNKRYSQG